MDPELARAPERENGSRWLVGLALGMVLTLLALPATGWILRSQAAMQFGAPSWVGDDGRSIRAARERPGDWALQLALIERQRQGSEAAHALCARFPESAALRANVLRLDMRERVRLHRDAEYLVADGKIPERAREEPASRPEHLEQFDLLAIEGERLDPENAFFPFMRSAGLLASGRDEEALAALRRAAEGTRWQEYLAEAVEGEWRLSELAGGRPGALPRVAQAAGLLLPHYQALRTAARVAVYRAMQAEQAGRAEEGLAIRRSVARCGSLMRLHASCAIGALVGIAITDIVTYRPAGAPPIKRDGPERLAAYCAFLDRAGHPEEAWWMRKEAAAGARVRELVRQGGPRSMFGPPLLGLGLTWFAGLATLTNALWMLVLGGVACLLARTRHVAEGRPLPRYAQVGTLAGLVCGVAGAAQCLSPEYPAGTLALPVVVALIVLGGGVARCRGKAILGALGVLGLTMLCGALIGLALFYQTSGVRGDQSLLTLVLSMVDEGTSKPWASPAWTLASLLLPLAWAGIFAVGSRVLRVPVSVGLVRGFRGAAVPTACVLLLLNGGLVLAAARQEALIEHGVQETLKHEGRYLAGLVGQDWPGPVRW